MLVVNLLNAAFSLPKSCDHPIRRSAKTYAYELQQEVDFWLSGACRGGVSRKHAPDGGSNVASSGVRSTPVNVGGGEPLGELLHMPRRRHRGQAFHSESRDDAVDRLIRATMGGDGGETGGMQSMVNANLATEKSATSAAKASRSFDKIEIGATTTAPGAGRGWFWGAVA